MKFDHIAIHVYDLEKSAAFYENVLGLVRIPEPFHDNLHIWLDIGPHASLHLVGGAPAIAEHKIDDHFAFYSESFDDVMALLDRLNIPYRNFRGTAKVSARRDGVQQIYLQDPDGYWIEVNDAKP